MDCSLPGSSVHEVLQARILEWVAIPFRGSTFSLPPSVTIYFLISLCLSSCICVSQGFIFSFFSYSFFILLGNPIHSWWLQPSDFRGPPLQCCLLSPLVTEHFYLAVLEWTPQTHCIQSEASLLPSQFLCLSSGILPYHLYISTLHMAVTLQIGPRGMNECFQLPKLEFWNSLLTWSSLWLTTSSSLPVLVSSPSGISSCIPFFNSHCHYLDVTKDCLLVFIAPCLFLVNLLYLLLLEQSWFSGLMMMILLTLIFFFPAWNAMFTFSIFI